MSTANKLTYLNTTKTKIKSAINLTGANLTNETFRQYPQKLYDKYIDIINNGTDSLYSNLPKVTGTGTELTLTNTTGAPMRIGLSASDSTQKTTTGKNLFNKNGTKEQYYYDSNGVKTYDTAEHLFINQTYDNIDFSSICISFSSIVGYASVRVCEYNSGGTFIKRTLVSTNGQSLNLDNNTTKVIFSTNAADDLGFVDLQIEKGSTATSYEEYTNGASPNPDYPQDINVVTGNNKIIIDTINKNLIDRNNFPYVDGKRFNDNGEVVTDAESSYTTFLYPATPGETYTIQGTQSQVSTNTRIYYYDINKNFMYRGGPNVVDTYSFTIPSNCYYFSLQLRKSAYIDFDILQLEKGSTATAFTPHINQNYSISLGSLELAKIGNYKDEIFQNTTDSQYYDSNLTTDGWYKKKRIGKVVLDGSESWNYQNNHLHNVDNILPLHLATNDINGIMSTCYFGGLTKATNQLFLNSVENYNYVCGLHPNGTTIRFKDTRFDNVNDLTNWLSNNNVPIYYILATPTDEPITDTTLVPQLNAFKNAVSYANETNISQTNANRPFMINASAIKNSME